MEHGIPENIPIDELLVQYCGFKIENKDLIEIFYLMQLAYKEAQGNVQPTYGVYSSYRCQLRYNFLKSKVLELDCWNETDRSYYINKELFKLK
jgi:hypothetical protein